MGWKHTGSVEIQVYSVLISALDGRGRDGQRHAPAALGNIPGTHYIGDWVDVGAVWTGAENLALTGVRTPGGTDLSDVAIPTTVTPSLQV